ncbi:uncharacterized protein TNCV_1149721 [Trichonephila clavipes]|nr:uncharacterized protein TNCV_1149721 [Trichonephila clavipes]
MASYFNPTIVVCPEETQFVCRNNIESFCCPCLPFDVQLQMQTLMVSRQSSCAENVCAVETSNERQGNTDPDINLRITQAFPNIGKGYSAIEKFGMAVNVYPFSSRTYSKCIKLLHTDYGIAAETLQSEVHREVRKAYEAPIDVPVVDMCFI